MKTEFTSEMIESDVNEVKLAATKLANHVYLLGLGFGFGTTFLKFLASVAAIYLLILDRTNWKTNMLTSLLIPYIFLSLPSVVFSLLRGDVGKWIAFVAVVLRLFFPRHFPDWLEMPGSLILLLVVAPSFFAYTIRDDYIGVSFAWSSRATSYKSIFELRVDLEILLPRARAYPTPWGLYCLWLIPFGL